MKRCIAMLGFLTCVALADDDPFADVPDRRLPYGMRAQYFPVSTNGFPSNAVSPFCNGWYSAHLRRMQEPSLLQATNRTDIAAYRFTYLPTWGRPFAVRTVVTTNQVYLRTVRLTGDGGYDPGHIGHTTDCVLSNGLPRGLSKLIEETIWNTSFQPVTDRGCDGSEWILEGVRNGKYRLFTMWSPDAYSTNTQGKQFVRLCSGLAEMSGVRMDKVMQDCHTLTINPDPLRQENPNQ
jgi:hypothetical protein